MIPIWIAASVSAAAAQTARNAMQSGLTAKIGTIGATQVRFLFGLPFALLMLAGVCLVQGQTPPLPSPEVWRYALLGGLAQIAATAFMLYVMKTNGFAISTAWLKGEPVIVAVIGWAVLGDQISLAMLGAIMVAVLGVLVLSVKPGIKGAQLAALQPAALGLIAGACFGLSAIGFRGGILALASGDFWMRAITMLALSLAIQSTVLLLWMALFDRQALRGSLAAWRPSILAGFFGAAASAGWFIAFSQASAAHVRTLALIEVIFALLVSRYMLRQQVSPRQLLGMAILVLGVGLLLRQG